MNQLEQHRTALVLLGIEEAGDWRPEDARLREMVRLAAASVESLGYVDAKLVLAALREIDAEYEWAEHYFYLVESYQAREEEVEDLKPLMAFLHAAKRLDEWSFDLEKRLCDLLIEIGEWRESRDAVNRMQQAVMASRSEETNDERS